MEYTNLALPAADVVHGPDHLYRIETVSAIQDASYAAGRASAKREALNALSLLDADVRAVLAGMGSGAPKPSRTSYQEGMVDGVLRSLVRVRQVNGGAA